MTTMTTTEAAIETIEPIATTIGGEESHSLGNLPALALPVTFFRKPRLIESGLSPLNVR
jgi:hypothetical protein